MKTNSTPDLAVLELKSKMTETKTIPPNTEMKKHYDFFYQLGKVNPNYWTVDNSQKLVIAIQAEKFTHSDVDSIVHYCNQNGLNYQLDIGVRQRFEQSKYPCVVFTITPLNEEKEKK